jgi:ElaB/YqjD/DUF883 family membrane-anchored ribosome-binding protein
MTNKTVSNGEDGIGQRVSEATDRLVDLKDDVTKSVDRQVKTLRAVMKDHPIAVLAVALGAGYLIARLVHR